MFVTAPGFEWGETTMAGTRGHVLRILFRFGGVRTAEVRTKAFEPVVERPWELSDRLSDPRRHADPRVDEADLRQAPRTTGIEEGLDQMVMVGVVEYASSDHHAHWDIGEVVGPRDAAPGHQVEHRSARGRGGDQRVTVGHGCAVGGPGQEEAAVRVGRARKGAEPPVRKGER
jgi:hypothetical protein